MECTEEKVKEAPKVRTPGGGFPQINISTVSKFSKRQFHKKITVDALITDVLQVSRFVIIDIGFNRRD